MSIQNSLYKNGTCLGWIFLFLLAIPVVGFSAENQQAAESGFAMGHDTAGTVVIARVNGVEIDMTMLMEKMFTIAQKKYGRKEISPLVAKKIKADATEELITEELAYQKSYAVIGDVTPDSLNNAIEELRALHGGEEGLEKYLEKEGTTVAEYRRDVARALTVKLFIKQELEDKITVSDDEIKAAYLGAKDKYFVQKEDVRVTDIVFFLDSSSADSVEKAEAIKEKIIREYDGDPIKMPRDGTFIAKENVKLDRVKDKILYDVARELGEHGLSDPMNIDGTLHIVQLTGYRPEITKDLDNVRAYLTSEIKQRKKEFYVRRWIEGLRDGAKIELIEMSQ